LLESCSPDRRSVGQLREPHELQAQLVYKLGDPPSAQARHLHKPDPPASHSQTPVRIEAPGRDVTLRAASQRRRFASTHPCVLLLTTYPRSLGLSCPSRADVPSVHCQLESQGDAKTVISQVMECNARNVLRAGPVLSGDNIGIRTTKPLEALSSRRRQTAPPSCADWLPRIIRECYKGFTGCSVETRGAAAMGLPLRKVIQHKLCRRNIRPTNVCHLLHERSLPYSQSRKTACAHPPIIQPIIRARPSRRSPVLARSTRCTTRSRPASPPRPSC
jgi:hypothetical protein